MLCLLRVRVGMCGEVPTGDKLCGCGLSTPSLVMVMVLDGRQAPARCKGALDTRDRNGLVRGCPALTPVPSLSMKVVE